MKPVKTISLCALISALACVVLLASYIPYITYASAAVAGALFIVPVIESGKRNAFLSYIVTAFFALFFAESYSKVLFICFFGYYPILKAILEKIKNTALSVVLKLLSFNTAAVLSFFIINYILLIPLKAKGTPLLFISAIIVANIVFLVYDYAVSGIVQFYIQRLHNTVCSMLKGNRK